MDYIDISKIAEIICGFPFQSEYFNTNGDGTRLVRGMNVTKRNLRWGEDSRWWNDFSVDLSKYQLQENDIVIGMDGSLVGKNYAKISKEDLPLLLVQRVACIRAKSNADQKFLWHCIANSRFEKYIESVKTGTTIPHISQKQISQFQVPNLPLPTQQKIAQILTSLDDKIELNNKINTNLEQQAQALFKSWFVDFEPFGGEMPAGWKVGKLSDLINIKYGKDHKKLEDGNIPVYGSGGIMRYVGKSLYDNESVLIPRKGTLSNVFYIDEPFWSVDTMFYSEMKEENIAKFVYFFVKSKDLEAMNAGSAVPSMTTEILNALELVIPSKEYLEKFETVVSPMFRQIKYCEIENKKLSTLRDTLLPKLMNGEIES